jgi:hypothetical protein
LLRLHAFSFGAVNLSGELKMNFTRTKTLGLAAIVAASVLIPVAFAAGLWQGYPIIGKAAFCESTNSQSGSNTVPGTIPSGNCTTTVPTGPTTMTGLEVIPMDTGVANGAGPATVLLPSQSIANGFGGTTVATTTGTTAAVVVADAISTYVYAGAGTATYTSLSLPPNPIQNQKFCLVDAGTGILTTTAIVVGTSGQTIVGTAPTSIPVQVASGAQATVTNASVCYVYTTASKVWYRVS